MKVLLDTHILVQAAAGQLSKERTRLLELSRTEIFFSAISMWEITKLAEHGRLLLREPLEAYLHRFLSHPRYQCIGLEPEILGLVYALGKSWHKDPADQLILATALHLESALMTDDGLLRGVGGRTFY